MNSRNFRSATTTRFKQQELAAWQPIVTPGWVIAVCLLVAVVFIPSGLVAVRTAREKFEIIKLYDDGKGASECSINEINEGYTDILAGNPRECLVSFELPNDVSLVEDLYLYYELETFYQNHRRYVISRSDLQLKNEISFGGSFSDIVKDLEPDCDPLSSLFSVNDNTTLIHYPCGLVAQSYFNDGIQLSSFKREDVFDLQFVNTKPITNASVGDTPLELSLERTDVAFTFDVDNSFRNPVEPDNYPRYDVFKYLWQTYDQFSCYDAKDPSIRKECVTWDAFVKSQEQTGIAQNAFIPGDGCAPECANPEDIFVDEGGIKPPSNRFNPESDFGLRTENFIVWMRNGALPTFRNLFARVKLEFGEGISLINANENGRILQSKSDFGFKKGDVLTFRIVPNFLVSEFSGKKKLILSTVGPIESNSRALGAAYLSLGIVSLTISALVFVKMKYAPRKLGDPRYLNMKTD